MRRAARQKRIKQMSGQVSSGSAGEYQADERAFFFNDTATTEIYTLSLHDALPISSIRQMSGLKSRGSVGGYQADERAGGARLSWRVSGRRSEEHTSELQSPKDLVCRLLLEKKKGEYQADERVGVARI